MESPQKEFQAGELHMQRPWGGKHVLEETRAESKRGEHGKGGQRGRQGGEQNRHGLGGAKSLGFTLRTVGSPGGILSRERTRAGSPPQDSMQGLLTAYMKVELKIQMAEDPKEDRPYCLFVEHIPT